MHTDTSLHLLDITMTALGAGLWHFVGVTCPNFATLETNSEYTKRRRRKTTSTSRSQGSSEPMTRQLKTLSLKMIKLHFLGDYIECIKLFGTTDNYTTALVRPSYTAGDLLMSIVIRGSIVTSG